MAADSISRAQLRKEFIIKRSHLTQQQIEEKSAKAVERIVSLPAFKDAKTILVYNHIRSELSLDALIRHPSSMEKRIAYPLCMPEYEMKVFIPGKWQTGHFGIREPEPDSSVEITPEELDLVICPGVAFDAGGHRLGMGSGYYDRFLPKCKNAVIVMAAFEVQRAEQIPCDEWDYVMDMVVTEERVYS